MTLSLFKKSPWLLMAFITFLAVSCSDDKDNTETTGHYKLMVSDYSDSYAQNSELADVTTNIIAIFSPEQTGFESTSEDANKRWKNACDSLLKTNWIEQDVMLGDTTWIEVALVMEQDGKVGNTIVNRRRVEYPCFTFSFRTDNSSANYALNVKAQQEVENILNTFYAEGQSGFAAKLSDAKNILQTAGDSILKHNWKRNDLAIQSNSSFTLQLTGGTASLAKPWPVYASKEITLPHY